MIYLYRSSSGVFIRDPRYGDRFVACPEMEWDAIFRTDRPADLLADSATGESIPKIADAPVSLVSSQEVWAAGVTYFRSRTARMEESETAGSFYDRVYEAERPELFFKGNARTVVASGEPIRIRDDSKWNVPEPELVLVANAAGRIIGYTAGNDVSSRDIEGENPLYLPQAKVYDGSCALGPAIVVSSEELDREMRISLTIQRAGDTIFAGDTSLRELRRDPEELVRYLYRNQSFRNGCFLMTGTGIVPGDDVTLEPGDVVSITVGALPPLVNSVAPLSAAAKQELE